MSTIHPLRLRAFITQIDSTGGPDACWTWRGDLYDGYGRLGRKGDQAHRVAYELMVRPIPAGMVIDHLCHNHDESCPGGSGCVHRRCVNPAHLEAVTQRDNVLRSPHTMPNRNAAKTECPQGHPYDEANTYSRRTPQGRARRECRTCRRERLARRAAA
ncbi:HNH endonuclease signature motif containing protein [Micromonospora sp. NBRC 101691]|uniref:HNH endonuclease signature motif containing protein n=1 Tax=Micromonospora sp. NBRC 101691 TaxID=3032198 RepID=UPI0024A08A60|nr:HNH endonuclease signature motif containing protein [Micromonospora sp. NBRC 101691]GLY21657.1 hypothetical protein Misp04_13890 [Micromonospora sp. NBRC 101691]